MGIIKTYKYQGHIDEIIERNRAFSKLKNAQIKRSQNRRWEDIKNCSFCYQTLAVFVGKSGYGKSSTVNAFWGNSILQTSDIDACTRECQSLDFRLSSDCYFSLGDLPGIGENEHRNQEYLNMYRDFLRFSTVIIYVLRADTRDYSIDEAACNYLFSNIEDKKKVIFALNCCDKVEPISRVFTREPSLEQMQNIQEKVNFVSRLFQPINNIVPYSASTGWNMNILSDEIVKVILASGELIFPDFLEGENSSNSNVSIRGLSKPDMMALIRLTPYFIEMSEKIRRYHKDHNASREQAENLAVIYIKISDLIKEIRTQSDLESLIEILEKLKEKISQYKHESYKYRWSTSLEKEALVKLKDVLSQHKKSLKRICA